MFFCSNVVLFRCFFTDSDPTEIDRTHHSVTFRCLAVGEDGESLLLKPCDTDNKAMNWTFKKVVPHWAT